MYWIAALILIGAVAQWNLVRLVNRRVTALEGRIERQRDQQKNDYWRQEKYISTLQENDRRGQDALGRVDKKVSTLGSQLNDLALAFNDVVKYDVATRWATFELPSGHRLHIHHSQKPIAKGGPEEC